MIKFINEENRQKLIEGIQKAGNFWSATMQSSAMHAIRNPKDKMAQEDAARYMLMYDTQQQMAKDIIDLVVAYWPREEKKNVNS